MNSPSWRAGRGLWQYHFATLEGLASSRPGRHNRLHGIPIYALYIAGGWLLPGRKRVVLYSIQTLKRLRPTLFRQDLIALLDLLQHAHELLGMGRRDRQDRSGARRIVDWVHGMAMSWHTPRLTSLFTSELGHSRRSDHTPTTSAHPSTADLYWPMAHRVREEHNFSGYLGRCCLSVRQRTSICAGAGSPIDLGHLIEKTPGGDFKNRGPSPAAAQVGARWCRSLRKPGPMARGSSSLGDGAAETCQRLQEAIKSPLVSLRGAGRLGSPLRLGLTGGFPRGS